MRAGGLALLVAMAACSPKAAPKDGRARATPLLPDIRTANGRPPVVLVMREGDPAAAISVAITTAGVPWQADGPGDDPEPATALAGVVESRLRAKGIDAVVTPSWDGLRASVLATNVPEAMRVANALREALLAPIVEADLALARRKLAALTMQPLRDRALGRWARCVGRPYSLPERAGKDAEVDILRLERLRAASFGLGRVAIAVTGPPALAEAVTSTILRGAVWKPGHAPKASAAVDSIDVYETTSDTALVHTTLDVGTNSAAVTTAEALGDPHGPLAARLSDLDLPFRVREVTAAANARGGCVGVVIEAIGRPADSDLASRVADAIALVQLEASVHLGETGAARDGRLLARRSGDARESAERAAWWALVNREPPKAGHTAVAGSVALGVPLRRGAKDGALEPSREVLVERVARAKAAWEKPVVEARSRVEAGQGEAWILVGSPCGTEGETDADSGLTALFAAAAAGGVRPPNEIAIEPWVAADGAGLLVHGPPLAGETPSAHARRLADIAARSFAAEPLTGAAIGRARSDLLRRDVKSDGAALSLLATALAPQHPSWIIPWGSSEPLARSSDSAVVTRAQALRAGPVRMAILANADATQADAAIRAADRWVARRSTDTRACRAPSGTQPAKPGTYSTPSRPGALPEAYLAFPLPPGDEAAKNAASLVAAALGEGLLERALGVGAPPAGDVDNDAGAPGKLAYEASARVLGWPRAPALVLRVVASQALLDPAVMQTRALVDRLRQGGLPTADFERATAARARIALGSSLDPRARVVATWRGESPGALPPRVGPDEVRAFAQRHLAEDAMVVVASRPPRPPANGP